MKKIEVIIRMSKVCDVITALSQVGYQSAEISDVEERERGKGPDENPQGKTYMDEPPTKRRLEIIVKDEDVKKIIIAIREASQPKKIGDGSVFRHPLYDTIHIRSVK
jgi:nitrogen regulatory protein PII